MQALLFLFSRLGTILHWYKRYRSRILYVFSKILWFPIIYINIKRATPLSDAINHQWQTPLMEELQLFKAIREPPITEHFRLGKKPLALIHEGPGTSPPGSGETWRSAMACTPECQKGTSPSRARQDKWELLIRLWRSILLQYYFVKVTVTGQRASMVTNHRWGQVVRKVTLIRAWSWLCDRGRNVCYYRSSPFLLYHG